MRLRNITALQFESELLLPIRLFYITKLAIEIKAAQPQTVVQTHSSTVTKCSRLGCDGHTDPGVYCKLYKHLKKLAAVIDSNCKLDLHAG